MSSPDEQRRPLVRLLHQETVAGVLLLVATAIALVWANSPAADLYVDLRDARIGPQALHLHLSVAAWAADGLLAIFFYVVGLELKRELTVGALRRPAEAVLPAAAALAGMALPAIIYLGFTWGDDDLVRGWVTPTATDIAFCLAVLAVVGRAIPAAVRVFLLTLAVVDDLVAILLIAVLYSDHLDLVALMLAVTAVAAYGAVQRAGVDQWWVLLPLGLLAWGLTHAAGVHPTVAAVALGLATRVAPRSGQQRGAVERFEAFWRPVSAGLAVPVFALLSAGISVSPSALSAAMSDRAALGVFVGRVLGKSLGISLGAYLMVRLTAARLSPHMDWPDVFGVATLCGIGFAVPLLVSDISFGAGSAQDDRVTAAILASALVAAGAGAVLLRARHRHYDASRAHDGDPRGASPGV